MNRADIAFICDNDFVMQTSVAVTSALLNKNKDTEYNIYIVTSGISEENKGRLKELDRAKCKIIIIEASTEKFKNLHQFLEGSYLSATEAALLKFNLQNILSGLDKVLYLDGDVIVRGDLSPLFNVDLENNYAAAIHDTGKLYWSNNYNTKIQNYFNSGVMLLNLKKLREQNFLEKFIETKRILNDRKLMDQNVFNIVFQNKVKIIDIKWNLLIVNLERAKAEWNIKQINKLFGSHYKNFSDIKKHAVILHFSSKDKPWKFYDVPFGDIWRHYYLKSPFGNIKLALDYISRPLPLQEKIFSVKNDNYCHKVIRFLGFKINIYSKKRHIKSIENHLNFINSKIKDIKNEHDFLFNRGINKENISSKAENFCGYGITEIKRNKKLIVSLTSYPKRIYDLHYCLYSLLNQTLKPDEVILWLAEEQFPNKERDIPRRILKMKDNGLSIKWCRDLKSYKKLIPAKRLYPDDIIITADDDIFYAGDWLEKLYAEYSPECITAHRCHRIIIDENNRIMPYDRWEKCIVDNKPSFLNFATGAGGIMYPPDCFYKDFFNEKLFMSLAPTADDIWFWAMSVLNGTGIKTVTIPNRELIYINPVRELNLNDDGTLFAINKQISGNDKQISDVLEYYPELYMSFSGVQK